MTFSPAAQKSRKRLSLQSVLIIPFLLQIFAAVGLTGYFSLRNGQKAVQNLATQLQVEVSNRVSQHLEAYLATPPQLNEINVGAAEMGLLNLQNFEQTGRYFWQQMQVFDVGYIAFGDTTGNYISVERYEDETFYIADNYLNTDVPDAIAFKNEDGNTLLNLYEADENGNRSDRLDESDGEEEYVLDHRQEAWYTEAVEAGEPIWSSVYQWDSEPEVLSIAASYPIYDDQDTLTGVIGVDHILSQIDDFLIDIEMSPAARIFIVEQDGKIVASSSREKSYVLTEGVANRVLSTESSDPLIRTASTYLQAKFGEIANINTKQQISFDLEGEKQFLQVTPWQDELGISWLVMVAVPESDFMAQIYRNTRITIGLCVISAAIAGVLGILTARWVTKPILRLKEASRNITTEQLDQKTASHKITALSQQVDIQGTEEVATLAQTFNRMIQQLRESFVALERSKVELEIRVEERTAELHNKNGQLADTLQNLKATQTQMIAQEKLASLGSLTAGIAHEIKNPLNFVNNFSELATDMIAELGEEIKERKEQFDPEFFLEVTEILDDLNTLNSKICHHGNRADSIVVNMLQHSRSGTGEHELVNINKLVAEAASLAYHGITAKQSTFNLAFDNDYDDSIGLIQASPQDLSRVFLNIVNNACYAIYQRQQLEGEDFKPLLKLRTRKQNGVVEVHIRDNGTGMTPEVKEKVFDQFFTTKPTGEGTGLGLSLSYNIIVEQHQGTLTVESEEGIYTDFIVTLPA